MARKVFKKKPAEKVEAAIEEPIVKEVPTELPVAKAKNAKAISVDDMVEENLAAVVSSDYQKYLRKLMKEAQGRF